MKKSEPAASVGATVLAYGLLSFCGLFQGACALPTKGLVAYYPLDGSAIDRSGSDNHGRVEGPLPTMDRMGRPSRAYAFDGKDDYIRVPDSETLRLTGPVTMSAWFETTHVVPFAAIICKAEPNEPRHGYLMDINDHNEARADVINDHSLGVGQTLTSSKPLTDGRWHHVLAAYDGHVFRLYVDGQLDREAAYDEGMQANSEPLLIGWDQNRWLSHRHFQGSIDDVRIYRRGLSAKEARALFRAH